MSVLQKKRSIYIKKGVYGLFSCIGRKDRKFYLVALFTQKGNKLRPYTGTEVSEDECRKVVEEKGLEYITLDKMKEEWQTRKI